MGDVKEPMKLPTETEEEFICRQLDARRKGIVIFRDDSDREFLLDVIEDYINLMTALGKW